MSDSEPRPAADIIPPPVSPAPLDSGALGKPAVEYLARLIENIDIMLDYVNSNGIAMPPDLRDKLDRLMQDPTLEEHDLFLSTRKGKSR